VGSVRLDGAEVFVWDKAELGPHIGYLPQEVALFEGTVAQNIARFGKPDRKKIRMAARMSGVHAFIATLPKGYDTDIGTEGTRLSGGQRQRIGLARALYGNPRLVVLDEPNASLDETGEKALLDALNILRAAGATVVVITHRKNLLDAADLMLLLVEGEAKMFGPRKDVLAALNNAGRSPAPHPHPHPVHAPGALRAGAGA
jgi:ABC-type protease/lipase transport system fused ATPase/permease subunit